MCSWRAKSSSKRACRSDVSFKPRFSRYLRKIFCSRLFMGARPHSGVLRLSLNCSILLIPAGTCQDAGKGAIGAMWQGFTIALREGIEAFLIVALILSYLKRTGRAVLARAVYAGTAVSVVTCFAAGLLFAKAEKQTLLEGILALVAAALVGSLLFYMKRVSSRLKSDIESRIESKTHEGVGPRAFWGVF